jgi:hypothetical protein
MAKRKPVMFGRQRSSHENNIKMDLGKVEGGWRIELTAFSSIHFGKSAEQLVSAEIAFVVFYREYVNSLE